MGLFCLILPSQLGTWYSQICLLWLGFCLPGLLRYLLIMIFSERRGKTPVGKVQACFFTAGFDRKKDVLQKDWEILLQLQTVRLPTTVTNLTRHAETRAHLAPVVISDTSCAHYFSFFCANCCSIRVVRPTKISCNHRFCATEEVKQSEPAVTSRMDWDPDYWRSDAIGRHHARNGKFKAAILFRARASMWYRVEWRLCRRNGGDLRVNKCCQVINRKRDCGEFQGLERSQCERCCFYCFCYYCRRCSRLYASPQFRTWLG